RFRTLTTQHSHRRGQAGMANDLLKAGKVGFRTVDRQARRVRQLPAAEPAGGAKVEARAATLLVGNSCYLSMKASSARCWLLAVFSGWEKLNIGGLPLLHPNLHLSWH